jgi:hypothetical protein
LDPSARAAIVLVMAALTSLAPGCGPGGSTTGTPAVPTLTRRLESRPELKKLIGPDGKPLWKPGMPIRPPRGSGPRRP